VSLSEIWEESDKSIYMVHNFTDVRQKMDVNVNSLKIDDEKYVNDTISLEESEW